VRVLLVAAAPREGSESLVAELAASADMTIAVDGGGAVCLAAGVVPNVVLGDFDSLTPAALERIAESGAWVVRFPAEKDETDLELALAEARSAGADEVVLTCATAERLDHTLAALGALAANADLRPELAETDLSGWVLAPGGRDSVELEGEGATVSLVALGSSAVVSATGVRWPLEAAELRPGSGLGISNVITDRAGARFSVTSGSLLVLAPILADGPRATMP